MAAGDITFIQCPQGDSFPVQKTSSRSSGAQQVVCPRCGRSFEVKLEETVERLSPGLKFGVRVPVTRFA